MQEEPKDRWSTQHWRVVAGIAAAGVAALAIVVATTSSDPAKTNSIALAGGDGAAAVGTVNCPTVADKLPAVPASAAAEVQRNLTLLQTQIDEANNRLVATVGQGGPNFIQNAILGPLEDKRVATVNRIATAIGRTAARPAGLEAFAPCTLNAGGAVQSPAPDPVISTAPAADPAATATASAEPNAGSGAVPTVNCPTVADKLPAIPASAAAEVQRNLTLLQTQITEANNRLVSTVGQGGPNFIQNAILGPLEDKRVATVNRIATAIGRTAARPAGLEALAPCTLNESGAVESPAPDPAMSTAPAPAPAATATASAGSNAGSGAVPTVNCPTVADKLPAIPASAAAEVQRNLTLLQTQITEANNRLVSTVGQGGPNFIQNAILGPLQGKRSSTIDRIAIAIGRTAARPTGLDALAACSLNN